MQFEFLQKEKRFAQTVFMGTYCIGLCAVPWCHSDDAGGANIFKQHSLDQITYDSLGSHPCLEVNSALFTYIL
jgi:hypothetical protein